MIKNIFVAVFALIVCVSFSSCGVPKEYDFYAEEDFYTTHEKEFTQLFSMLENNSWYDIYNDTTDGKYYYTPYKGAEPVLLSPDAEQIAADLDLSTLYVMDNGDIQFETYHNGWFLKSYKNIEDIECPYHFSGSEEELSQLNLEKEVEEDKIHFIADHRKDKETYWSNMYYRVDVKRLNNNIYSYELQEKYPWTSIFSV